MKHYRLRTTIAVRFAMIVLAVVFLISIVSNVLINRQFEKYVEEQQRIRAEEMAQNLSGQYNALSGEWNLDYVHGLGMYALNEGYIIKLYDSKENILWDAENHDMTLCHQMMDSISLRMKEQRPDMDGEFVTHRFDLTQGSQVIGFLYVNYYSPYYLNENGFQFVKALNQILLAVGAVSLLGAVLMGILLANSIAKPITKTVEITKQISEGDYAIRFQDDVSTAELLALAQSVNQMAASLQEQEALRKRLTSDIAHELRTPIANVSSYLEAILEGVWEPTSDRLKSCYEELDRISKLVSDLDRLWQIENENLNLHKTEVNLLESARTAVQNFDTQLAQKQLLCTVTGTPATVLADYDRIQQVFTNLISNAIKYSNEGGNIRVIIEETKDAGVIRVEDDGIGIAQKDLPLIFERFYRTDRSRNRKTGGVGIGLTIVKTIVQSHGGRIEAKSEEGRGSQFLITLPKKQERKTPIEKTYFSYQKTIDKEK